MQLHIPTREVSKSPNTQCSCKERPPPVRKPQMTSQGASAGAAGEDERPTQYNGSVFGEISGGHTLITFALEVGRAQTFSISSIFMIPAHW